MAHVGADLRPAAADPVRAYPGLALTALLIPMIVSAILRAIGRAIGRGRSVVVATQAALLLGNAEFWLSFLAEFTLWE